MPKAIEVTLPVPPSVNRIWRTGNGRTYKDGKARAYELSVEAAWRTAKLPRPAFPAGAAVRYTLTWYRFPASGDLSNRLKLVEDSLNGLAWADDKQVVAFHAARVDVKRGKQRITLTIEEVQ